MRYGVHKRLPERGPGKQMAVVANDPVVRFGPAKPQKPSESAVDLFV